MIPAVTSAGGGPAGGLVPRAVEAAIPPRCPGQRPEQEPGTGPRHRDGSARGARRAGSHDGAERRRAARRAHRRRPAEGFLPDLLARAAHVLIQGFAADLRRRGASLPVWRVLAALLARPGETVTGLAEACLLQQPTMTKLLDRMVRDGLVARAPDARDRRIVRVALTRDGEAKAAELLAVAERHEAEVLARHPQAEGIKAALRDIIARSRPTPRAQDGESV